MSEAQLVADILHAFAGHPAVRIWRNNTGAARAVGGRVIRFGLLGQGDLSGLVMPTGRRLEIECKSPDGRQRPEQKRFQAMIERFGGLYVLARSVEDVNQAIAKESPHA